MTTRSRNPARLPPLYSTSICRGLEPVDVADIERVARLRRLKKGEALPLGSSESGALLILMDGRLILVRIHEDGRRLNVAGLYSGMAIVTMASPSKDVSCEAAEALEDSYFYIVGRTNLDALVSAKPKFATNLVALLNQRVAFLEERLEMQAFLPVPARLASLLVRLSLRSLDHRVSHRRLAESVGASREVVTRTLDEFQAMGLVDLSRPRVVRITSPERLAEVAGHQFPASTTDTNRT